MYQKYQILTVLIQMYQKYQILTVLNKCYYQKYLNWAGAQVLWLWDKTDVQELVSLYLSTRY